MNPFQQKHSQLNLVPRIRMGHKHNLRLDFNNVETMDDKHLGQSMIFFFLSYLVRLISEQQLTNITSRVVKEEKKESHLDRDMTARGDVEGV